jgi:hypothetical protein
MVTSYELGRFSQSFLTIIDRHALMHRDFLHSAGMCDA